MADDKQFRSLPTVASLDTVVRRLAARLVNLEGEFGGDDGQLSKIWESLEELNLRVLFLMNTLQITQTLSPIADPKTGQVPKRKMTALEAYMQHGGREKLIAGIEAQAKAAAAEGGDSENLQTEEQADAAQANEGGNDAAADAVDAANGPSTLVNNPSKFDKQ